MTIIRRVLSLVGMLIGVVFLALMLAVILGPALYVEAAGDSAAGAVVAKRETISQLSELWSRQLSLDVRFQPGDTEEQQTANVADDRCVVGHRWNVV